MLGVVILRLPNPRKQAGLPWFQGGTEMKTAIAALSAASLFVAAPVFAQSVSSKAPRHEMRAKHKAIHPGTYGYATGMMQAHSPKRGYYYYPGAPGYAPTRDMTDISPQVMRMRPLTLSNAG